ncbi:MAG: sensor histidine kinase, partial [Nitrospira sp.]|nr:sensor histidine kinase [Nitrospira sp.]
MDIYEKLKRQAETIRSYVEIADVAFIGLRVIIFCGGLGWLLFSDLPSAALDKVYNVFYYFIAYSFLIYILLFSYPQRKRRIYGFALVFDLIYASLLVSVTGGFESSFFTGFYLITALYSFYYGLAYGTSMAAVAAVLYMMSSSYSYHLLHWTDFMVRVAFLFLLAMPLGMLSQKLKSDKTKIESLNKDLNGYIDELRDVQEKLIQVEKLSAIGRLTADVAHEIRNPLTSIGGFARRLNKRLAEGSREKNYAEIVVSEVDRLERILRDVLTFSKEIKVEMELHEINGVIKESLNTFAGLCMEQGIEVEENLDPSLPEILIDKDQIRQAVNNLISNAIDVMSDGGRLKVKSYNEHIHEVDYVAVEVADNGPGLPLEALDMIFEPFYTTKEIGAGTGLGLSICKKIMDEHHGLLYVESKPGEGATFNMMFPYQKKEESSMIPCWEFTKCGVENSEGAANM